MPVKIFFCYAHEDEDLLRKLKTQLSPLLHQGFIDVWHDRDISAGSEWEQAIKEQLNSAQIILLLVSPDFMASQYIHNVELKSAVERHERGEARVIPIILRYVHWQGAPFGKLQALPTDGHPVMSSKWHNQDEALFNVVEGLRKIIEELGTAPSIGPILSRAPDFSDPLTDNTKGYHWTEIPRGRQRDGSCVFSSNGYHITTLNEDYRFYKGFSEVLVLSNFVLQVDMKVVAGEEGGVLFRWNEGIPDTFYYFYVKSDGTFGLEKGERRGADVQHQVLAGEPNRKYVKGLGQQNTLRVRADGHLIELHVNEDVLARIDDNANPHLRGHTGFASGRQPSEVFFSNLKIWKIN